MNESCSVEIRELHLRDPFGLSRGTRRSVKNLFIRLGEGWGEGAPIYYHGQTVERMAVYAREWLSSSPDLNRPIDELLNEIQQRYPGETAFWQAFDLALHDRWGKSQNQPLRALWNIPTGKTLLSSFTIAMDTFDVMMEKVERAANYPILKVKVGGEQDLEIVRAIHQKTGKQIYVDANEGWSVTQALDYIPQLQTNGVTLIEQPLPRNDKYGYRCLRDTNCSGLPIILDESIQGPEDMEGWEGLADGINIKLAKCGGLARARRMVGMARRLGMKVMLGCMIESSLGVTAAAQLAACVDYLDLDGAALLADDPFAGLGFSDGLITLPQENGIGASCKIPG